jgi:hypothetical protein
MHLIILFVFNPLKQKNIHIRFYTVLESSLSSYQWITAAKYYGSSAGILASSSQYHNLCLHEENDSVFPLFLLLLLTFIIYSSCFQCLQFMM